MVAAHAPFRAASRTGNQTAQSVRINSLRVARVGPIDRVDQAIAVWRIESGISKEASEDRGKSRAAASACYRKDDGDATELAARHWSKSLGFRAFPRAKLLRLPSVTGTIRAGLSARPVDIGMKKGSR